MHVSVQGLAPLFGDQYGGGALHPEEYLELYTGFGLYMERTIQLFTQGFYDLQTELACALPCAIGETSPIVLHR